MCRKMKEEEAVEEVEAVKIFRNQKFYEFHSNKDMHILILNETIRHRKMM